MPEVNKETIDNLIDLFVKFARDQGLYQALKSTFKSKNRLIKCFMVTKNGSDLESFYSTAIQRLWRWLSNHAEYYKFPLCEIETTHNANNDEIANNCAASYIMLKFYDKSGLEDRHKREIIRRELSYMMGCESDHPCCSKTMLTFVEDLERKYNL